MDDDRDTDFVRQIFYVTGFIILLVLAVGFSSKVDRYILPLPPTYKIPIYFAIFVLVNGLAFSYVRRFPIVGNLKRYFHNLGAGRTVTLVLAAIGVLFLNIVLGYHVFHRIDPFDSLRNELITTYESCLKKISSVECAEISVEKCFMRENGYSERYTGPRESHQYPALVDKLTIIHTRYCHNEIKLGL